MAAAAPAAPADAGRAFYKVQVNREVSAGEVSRNSGQSQAECTSSCYVLSLQIYEIDTRYQKLKYISAGAYGMVCSAEDSVLGR